MKEFNSGWYLLYTRPRFEKKVSEFFHENEIHHFFPTSRILKQWKDRKKIVEVPLFPSYIFVHLDTHIQYFKVFESKGVLHYIKCGKDVVKINESLIQVLKSVVNTAGHVEISSECFKAGQHALITDGVLKGLTCEVIRCNGNRKVLIRVDILNRNVLVDLSHKELKVVN